MWLRLLYSPGDEGGMGAAGRRAVKAAAVVTERAVVAGDQSTGEFRFTYRNTDVKNLLLISMLLYRQT